MPAPLPRALAQSVRGRAATRKLKMTRDSTPPSALADALLDAVALFRELKIDYALIGGLAAMVHGRSRYTEDVDFVAQPGHEQVLAQHPEAMRKHGFDPGCTWKLYHRSGIDVDLWKDQHAGDIVRRAVRRKLGRRFARVAEPHDLIAMKLRADRPQDDYDIAEIIQAQRLDEDRLRALVSAAQFRRFQQLAKRVVKPS